MTRNTRLAAFVLTALIPAVATASGPPTYEITRSSTSGGVGWTSDGDLNLFGVVGQAEVGGQCGLAGGFFTAPTEPGTVVVLSPGQSIQAAINAAADCDVIILEQGTYVETIDFAGKAITVRSTDPLDPDVVASTIIDGNDAGRVVFCAAGEGPNTVLSGLTITGGSTAGNGGGMFTFDSSPTIMHCVFFDNFSNASGGGIGSDGTSSPTIIGCTFDSNLATFFGGGVSTGSGVTLIDCRFIGNVCNKVNGGGLVCFGGVTTVSNTLFAGNAAPGNVGGGAYIQGEGAAITFTNCTFSDNTAGNVGGAFYGAPATFVNCVVWGNAPDQVIDFAGVTVSSSTVQGGWPGAGGGNIDADPLFVDPDGPDDDPLTYDDNDYRLGMGSPSIDAGDTPAAYAAWLTTDLDGTSRYIDDPDTPDTGVPLEGLAMVDMGAYEYEFVELVCTGDIDVSGAVDVVDLVIVILQWGTGDPAADINADGLVDVQDLVEVILNWGPCP